MSLEDAVVRTVGLTSVTGAIGAAHDAGGAPGAPAYVGEERYDAVTTIPIPAIIIAVVSAARNHLRGCMHFLWATPVGLEHRGHQNDQGDAIPPKAECLAHLGAFHRFLL